jgi:hypothetical protein
VFDEKICKKQLRKRQQEEMVMNRIHLYSSFGILLLAVLRCSFITDKVTNKVVGDDIPRTNQLWNDVPPMDDMTVSDADMPLTMKLIMRTVLNNLWRFDNENDNQTPVSGDWMVMTTGAKPGDVESFYTNQRMASFGQWENSVKSSCVDGKDKGIDGNLCLFKKTVDNKETGLAIVAKTDESAKQTYMFFLRLERQATNNGQAANKTPRN